MSLIYIFSKLFTYLVLPPGIFIVGFFILAFYAKRFKAFFLVFALVFYLLSNSYIADFLLSPLETPYNKKINYNKKALSVIVLAGGSIVGSANIPIANDAYKRAMRGVMLAKSQNLPLLFSGTGLYKNYTESDAFIESMKEIEVNLGVSMTLSKNISLNKFALVVENKSLNTYQNAKFSKNSFENLNIKNPVVYLVTSAYHMKRSILLYKHFGFNVIPVATDFKISHKPKTLWDLLPNIGAFNKSYIALHEYAGLLS
ncbi:MAG: YdcF family protein, partial [Campylobacteraceae bacterium]|nr:YdcF family protein [Campylobacteraceae bacterium]